MSAAWRDTAVPDAGLGADLSVVDAATDRLLGEIFSPDAEVRRCPFDRFSVLRGQSGLPYSADIEAFVVSRHADMLEVLRQPEMFSSWLPFGKVSARREKEVVNALLAREPDLLGLVADLKPRRTPVLVNCDPPEHMRQRRLVQGAFAGKRISAVEPGVYALTHSLIDAFQQKGVVDLVPELAVALPVKVIALMLGVSDARQMDFKRWSDDFMNAAGNDGHSRDVMVAAMRGQGELFDFLRGEIADRRAHPREDLITDLLQARQAGDEPFSENEILAMCSQFLVAGNETTTALIGSALLTLARDAELADALRADPARVSAFLEEVLRRDGPVQGVFRTATQEVVIAGQMIQAGQQVFLLHGSANRDEASFRDEKLDASFVAQPRHVSFGFGEHFCLGSGLARMEARVVITAMLERFSAIEVVDDAGIAYGETYMMRSLKALPLRLTATEVVV